MGRSARLAVCLSMSKKSESGVVHRSLCMGLMGPDRLRAYSAGQIVWACPPGSQAGAWYCMRFSVQDRGFDPHIDGILRRAWTGMVGHHAPALRGLVVNIRGDHIGLPCPLRRDDFHPFNQVVH